MNYIKEDWYRFWAIVISSIGLVVFVCFIFTIGRNFPVTFNNPNLENTAQVGDFVGGFVGALWSFAGILLFYSALNTQQQSLKVQQEELKETKAELARTAQAQENQVNNQILSAKLQAINTLAEKATRDDSFLYTSLLEKTLIEIYGRNPETGASEYIDKLYEDVFAAKVNPTIQNLLGNFGYTDIRNPKEAEIIAEVAKAHGINQHFLQEFLNKDNHFGELEYSLNVYLNTHFEETSEKA